MIPPAIEPMVAPAMVPTLGLLVIEPRGSDELAGVCVPSGGGTPVPEEEGSVGVAETGRFGC